MSKAYIYKIISESPEFKEEEQYIGSTFKEVEERFRMHKYDYNKWIKTGNINYKIRSSLLFSKYGFDKCKIEIIEEIKQPLRDEVLRKEMDLIKNSPCCNRAGKIGITDFKQYKRDYYNKNKEILLSPLNCCVCNGKYSKGTKNRHERTEKHQTALNKTLVIN